MTETFTLNQLIRLLYAENSKEEQISLCNQLESDSRLNSTFHQLTCAFKALPKVEFSPSEASITNILKYSRESALQVQH